MQIQLVSLLEQQQLVQELRVRREPQLVQELLEQQRVLQLVHLTGLPAPAPQVLAGWSPWLIALAALWSAHVHLSSPLAAAAAAPVGGGGGAAPAAAPALLPALQLNARSALTLSRGALATFNPPDRSALKKAVAMLHGWGLARGAALLPKPPTPLVVVGVPTGTGELLTLDAEGLLVVGGGLINFTQRDGEAPTVRVGKINVPVSSASYFVILRLGIVWALRCIVRQP